MSSGKWTEKEDHRGGWDGRGQSPASASAAHRFRTSADWGNKAACLRTQFISHRTIQSGLLCLHILAL